MLEHLSHDRKINREIYSTKQGSDIILMCLEVRGGLGLGFNYQPREQDITDVQDESNAGTSTHQTKASTAGSSHSEDSEEESVQPSRRVCKKQLFPRLGEEEGSGNSTDSDSSYKETSSVKYTSSSEDGGEPTPPPKKQKTTNGNKVGRFNWSRESTQTTKKLIDEEMDGDKSVTVDAIRKLLQNHSLPEICRFDSKEQMNFKLSSGKDQNRKVRKDLKINFLITFGLHLQHNKTELACFSKLNPA